MHAGLAAPALAAIAAPAAARGAQEFDREPIRGNAHAVGQREADLAAHPLHREMRGGHRLGAARTVVEGPHGQAEVAPHHETQNGSERDDRDHLDQREAPAAAPDARHSRLAL